MLIYLSLIISYYQHRFFQPSSLLVGAECFMRLRWEPTPQRRIVSFAPEPVDNSFFDEYGWSDEVYVRLRNVYELISFIRDSRHKGCLVLDATLIYADTAE